MRSKLIIVFVILVVIALSVGAFFWYQARTARGLDLQISAPAQTLLGVPFAVTINVSNSATNVLQDVQLSLTLPEGLVFLGQPQDKIVEFRNLGNLGAGSLVKEEFQVMAIADEDVVRRLEANVSFVPFAVASRFEKEATADIAMRGSGIALDLTAPPKVFSGEDFELNISYRNISDADFRNLKLRITYPPTFSFRSATIKPDFGNNEWNLGDLRSGSEMAFTINGNVLGPAESFFEFTATIESEFLGQSYTISGKSLSIQIEPSPVNLDITVNRQVDYIAGLGENLEYVLIYTNNTNIGLRDVVIRAWPIGEMFDISTLSTSGFLRAADNAVVWNAANTPGLAVVPAGSSGQVSFKIKTKSSYPIRRLSDKNFVLKIRAEIESPTVPEFVAAERTLSMTSLESKVRGAAAIDAQAFFRDAASGILNRGPFPPKVGQPTQFTIHWKITNFSTDVSNVEVRSFLGGNVRFTGVVKSNINTTPTFNERTQEVLWLIDKIPATTGIITNPVEAIFQVEATPSSGDLNNLLTLLQRTELRAVDDFTGLEIFVTDSSLLSDLPDDPTTTPQQGVVTQ